MRAEAQELLEQQVQDEIENPDARTKAAMEIVQADHDANVSAQIAQGQALARERELADAAARELIEKEDRAVAGITDATHMISPDLQPTEHLEPVPEEWHPSVHQPKLRRRYVKRGSVYRRAKDASVKLRIGERVFIREQGHYQEIGAVEPGGSLPLIYLEDQL